MLNANQMARLEKIQRRATRLILNQRRQEMPYEERLNILSLTTLKEHWHSMQQKLAHTLESDPRLTRYFETRPPIAVGIRRRAKYKIGHTRMKRLENSPIISAIKILNGVTTTDT